MSKIRVSDNVFPIWTPQDSIDTARQFHLELDNAREGVEIADSVKMRAAFDPEWMFTQSRERRARLMDVAAVGLLLALMAAIGAIIVILAAPAHAAPDPVAVQYAAHYASAVCATLDSNPSTNGVHGVMQGIEGHGLTRPQAAYALALSVLEACPENSVLLTDFIDRWSGPVTL